MSIAIAEDHVSLAGVVADFLLKRDVAAAAKELLDGAPETLPSYWGEIAELGWLGLHLDESYGGSGYGLIELLVVVEEHGRALAPGPFVSTAAASAVLSVIGSDELKSRFLPMLATGERLAAVALGGDVTVGDGKVYGRPGPVVGGGLANLLVAQAGDDVVVVDLAADGVSVELPTNLDPTRGSARVSLNGAAGEVVAGGARLLTDLTRLVYAAEALGVARSCTDTAAEYAKIRVQFGRPIATFQAVKHHCANMLLATELATAAVWEAAGIDPSHGEAFTYGAGIAAVLAFPAADLCANLNIQVHGGIGFTWEHSAHLYLRRATVLESVIDPEAAAVQVAALTARGITLTRAVDLPPEAEPFREEVHTLVAGLQGRSADEQTRALVDTGYAVPHWPKPWGREASAVEQLVIEEELAKAGIKAPSYGITGWVILTLVQHANEQQIARWVRPALDQELIWCQLFSEPEAGSDAAGIKTRATKVEGGWRINGQKVWTSGAHLASFGLATVRTDPDAPKHAGITMMVIDMHGDGVEVRPLKMPTGQSEFNEVFFDDVFVPDADVVGPINGGWTVARATLGNESVSIGGGSGGPGVPLDRLVEALAVHPERLSGGAGRFGRLAASTVASEAMNLRVAHRALAGAAPGPEGAVSKLVLTENLSEAAAISVALAGPDGAFLDGPGLLSGYSALLHRAMSIAGGTSEIKRNQIGERLLGLPRDPLIS